MVGDQEVRAIIHHIVQPWTEKSFAVAYRVLEHGSLVAVEAKVDKSVTIGFGSVIGPDCVLEECVEIGARVNISGGTTIGAMTRVGDDVRIGYDCKIGEWCVVGDGSFIGDNNKVAVRTNFSERSVVNHIRCVEQ